MEDNKLQIFNNDEFGSVRALTLDGAPWFVGKDVAEILGYSNPRKAIIDHVDDEDKQDGVTIRDSIGREQNPILISESGLYSLILGSKLPKAKEFKRWVTDEVLPSIRKTGGYIAGQETLNDEELMAKALLVAQRTIEERNKRIGELIKENAVLTVDLACALPKAEYFDQLVDRNLLSGVRETAKVLGVPPKRFVGFLLEHKYLYRDKKGKLLPYEQKNSGYFELKECFNDKTGWRGTQTMVTPKGREAFRLLCLGGS